MIPLLLSVTCALSQTVEKGPYTLSTIAGGIYHIEDSNNSNPAGVHTDSTGKMTGMNNCSDMYLITGKDKALLIDLSNAVKWDTSAVTSLRSLVYGKTEGRKLLITITHKHGDHLGMLPAFINEKPVTFWVPGNEFKGTKIFPGDRTEYFNENSSLDLGNGFVVKSMEVPGHTSHSTVFFLEGKNHVFTGDAIGSGSGVWLFNYESFLTYKNGINSLIRYLADNSNGIDTSSLVIHGGHDWQKGKLDKLTARYIYDMKTLIDRIGQGTAEKESTSTQIPFLNTNFRYGSATITWNDKAAEKYRNSLQ